MRYLLALFFFFTYDIHFFFGQTKPVAPAIDYVTVDPETGFIEIYWHKSPSPGIVRYLFGLYIKNYPSYVDSTLTADTTHFILTHTAQPGSKAESVVVVAKDSAGQTSSYSPPHTTVCLAAAYDSCTGQTTLTWNPYGGWTAVQSCEVWYSTDNGSYQLLQTLPGTATSFVHPQPSHPCRLCYYVVSVRSDGIRSKSNKTCVQTVTFPSGISPELISLKPVPPSLWEVTCQIDTVLPSFYSWLIERSESPYAGFDTFSVVPMPCTTLRFTDAIAENPYYYRIAVIKKNCVPHFGEKLIVKPLLLKGEKKADEYLLSWSFYSPSDSYHLKEFTVYFLPPGESPEAIRHTMNDFCEITFADDLAAYASAEQLCFTVEAVLTSSFSQEVVMQSNTLCFSVETEVTVPAAFTPNDDGHNDKIIPRFNRVPSEVSFMVYDRWGKKVFETHSYGEGWDGMVAGKKAPEGIYTYIVKGTGFNEKKFEKIGYFSLIYP